MKRSPRPEKRRPVLSKREAKMLDRLAPVVEETHVTAQPLDESVKTHLDEGCSWIRPQSPEDN